MTFNIDTLYLELDNSQKQRLSYYASTKSFHSYAHTFKLPNNKTFEFEYTVELFEVDNFTFKVKQFKRGRYRLELYGLHQYYKNNELKQNTVIASLFHTLKYCKITRLDLCTDSKHKPRLKNLKTKKLVNYKTTIYHNLYNKNYFSSYVYDKQNKNNLSLPLWRTEYSFKGILRANAWSFQLRHLDKLIRRAERFIDKLELKAIKINKNS